MRRSTQVGWATLRRTAVAMLCAAGLCGAAPGRSNAQTGQADRKPVWLSAVRIKMSADKMPLDDALAGIFQQTSFDYFTSLLLWDRR